MSGVCVYSGWWFGLAFTLFSRCNSVSRCTERVLPKCAGYLVAGATDRQLIRNANSSLKFALWILIKTKISKTKDDRILFGHEWCWTVESSGSPKATSRKPNSLWWLGAQCWIQFYISLRSFDLSTINDRNSRLPNWESNPGERSWLVLNFSFPPKIFGRILSDPLISGAVIRSLYGLCSFFKALSNNA